MSNGPSSASNRIKSYKNKALDSLELRRRREEEGIQLRKQKREEQLFKRRNVSLPAGGEEDLSDYDIPEHEAVSSTNNLCVSVSRVFVSPAVSRGDTKGSLLRRLSVCPVCHAFPVTLLYFAMERFRFQTGMGTCTCRF